MNASPEVEFRPLTVPASIDAADAADFIEMVAVRNTVYREISGSDDEAMSPEELLPYFAPDPDETRRMWVVVEGGRIVGRVGVDIPHEAGSRVAFWLIELLESAQGRGIGTRAYELVEQTAREFGRTVLQSWAEHPDAPGERLDSPTGFGSIPIDRPARFYRRLGYVLEQVERKSLLDLAESRAEIDRLLDVARAASTGYRIVQWTAPTPPELVAGYAWAKSRMSTDAPSAAMEFDEETWDAERIARHDARYLESGRTVLVTAAVHEASGDVVAFNELVIGEDHAAVTHQEDTLVLKEHRGHKLGLLVKCAGLVAWREVAPASPRVITWNAEENRPMLDINEAIGFAPAAYTGAWKKVLA